MSPVVLGGIALAVGGLVGAGVGIAAGRYTARRHRDAEVAWWEDTYTDLAAAYRTDLQAANAQIAEALQIIARFTDTRLVDAEQGWPLPDDLEVPPSVWAALREAEENWEMN